MKKIVIIGANDFQNPLILKAKEMGYETHVFAWADGSIGEKTADFFYPISIINKDEIYEECLKIKPDAIVSIASDLAVITVNYVAQKLGLVCNSNECVYMATNKYMMRKCFLQNNIPTPAFLRVCENDKVNIESEMSFPLIVKPTDRSGSRGITKINSMEEFEVARQEAIKESFEKAAIVEEYIEGAEYSCECISYRGEHYVLAITKKYTTGAPHFIETGHIEPSGLEKEQEDKITNMVFRALDALKIENGASHSEFKIDKEGCIKIIEIGARMGGDCIGSNLVQLSTGYDFVKMVIDVAVGEAPDFSLCREPRYAGIKFIFNEQDYENMKILEKNKGELIVYKSDIVKTEKVLDSSSRWGFYIVAGKEREQLERIMES